jgi:hypothetical protein
MTCLVNSGMKREDASRLIHRKLEKMGFKFPDPIRHAAARLGAQIQKWRELVMEQERSGNLTDKSYRDALDLVKDLSAQAAAQRLLEITKSCHPRHFPSKS